MLSVRLTKQLETRFDRYCEALGVSKSSVVQTALERYLNEGRPLAEGKANSDPFLALLGSGNRQYTTDEIMTLTRGKDWNKPAVILVDSNIWIDLIQQDSSWFESSFGQIQLARANGPVHINAIIYAELAPTYDDPDELSRFIKASQAIFMPIAEQEAYLAGRAFLKYRAERGTKSGVLPEFFIGAQAQNRNWTILTRDKGRYRTYFPQVKLICP